MALEDKIDLLIEAIDRNTAALAAVNAQPGVAADAAPAKRSRKGRAAEEAKAEEEIAETPEPAEKVWTKQEVMDLAMAVVNIAGKAETQKVVKTYAPKLADVKEDDFAQLVIDLEILRDSVGEADPEADEEI
jgi:hypothetical protein